MRLLWLGLVALIILTCGGEVRINSITVRVVNESEQVDRVRIFCDGVYLGMIWHPSLNASTTRTIRAPSCRTASYRVETINDAFSPLDPILINPGDTLVITIRSYLPQTHHSVRKEGT